MLQGWKNFVTILEVKKIGKINNVAMINVDVVKREFYPYKTQASTKWREKTFHDLWFMAGGIAHCN